MANTLTGAGNVPQMMRGSVVTQRRRCGKPTCHCANGQQLHESLVLSYSQNGRSRIVMLNPDQATEVRKAVNRYKKAKTRIEQQGQTGLDTWLNARAQTRVGK